MMNNPMEDAIIGIVCASQFVRASGLSFNLFPFWSKWNII